MPFKGVPSVFRPRRAQGLIYRSATSNASLLLGALIVVALVACGSKWANGLDNESECLGGVVSQLVETPGRQPHTGRYGGFMTSYHLAQLNLGLFRAPLDGGEMAEFVAALEPINALAEATPGFVWRLKGEDGGSSSFVDVPGHDDPLWAPNLSVWEDLESLKHFIYRSGHAIYLRRRAEWFQKPDRPINVLWWIPAGHLPTLHDAIKRLDDLASNGPSDQGWPLNKPFDPPQS